MPIGVIIFDVDYEVPSLEQSTRAEPEIENRGIVILRNVYIKCFHSLKIFESSGIRIST